MKTFYELGWQGDPYCYQSEHCTDDIEGFYKLLDEFKRLKTDKKEQKTAFYQGVRVDKSKNKHRSTKEKATLWVIPDLDYDLTLTIKNFQEVTADYQTGNIFIKSGTYVLNSHGKSKLQLGGFKEFGILNNRWKIFKVYQIIQDVVKHKKNWILDKDWSMQEGDEIDISLLERLFNLDDKKLIVQIVSDIDIYKYRFLLRILFSKKQFKLADFGTKKNIPKLCGYYTNQDHYHFSRITIRTMTTSSKEEVLLALKHGLDIDLFKYEKDDKGKA